jgi:hypothetical protein
MRSLLSIVLLALAFPVTPAFAADSKPVIWIAPAAGYGTYSMSDVNDDIDALNAYTGLAMDDVSGGLAYGLQAGVNVTPVVSLFAGYERIAASTEVGDYSGSLEYDLPANAFFAAAAYSFPTQSNFHLGLAGLAGMVSAAGDVKISITGVGAASGDVTGSGLMFEGRAFGDLYAMPRLILTPSIGYRIAKISEFEVADQTVFNADGSKMALDYSGLTLRIALKIVLSS